MARPANTLDRFVSYTYHFELHAAGTWDDLLAIDGALSNQVTSRFESNGTLMINSRRDAHQVIEDVSFEVFAPGTSTGAPTGITDLTMQVKEPGGFSFIEKLKRRMDALNMSFVHNIVFGLKIMFVGRTADINASPEVLQFRTIPLCLVDMNANFTPDGGVYMLQFICTDTLATSRAGSVGPQLNYSMTNKSVSFDANTVEEAIEKLEERLNANYAETYKHLLNNNSGSRKISYRIELSPKIRGDVVGTVRNSFALDSKKCFNFYPTQSIVSMIMDIIARSPTLCEQIAATSKAMRQPGHSGAFMPVITPKVYSKHDVTEVIFMVSVYEGGSTGANTFEFDYFFASAGQNVDVESFNVAFVFLPALLATKAKVGTDLCTNMSGQLTNDSPACLRNSLSPNTTQATQYRETTKSDIDHRSGDTAALNVYSKSDSVGHASLPSSAVPAYNLARNAINDFSSSIEPTQTMVIRGHYQILEACISRPNELNEQGFLSGGSLWTKVNIWMPDARSATGKVQFFYTGKYQVLGVTNTFSGGQFKQTLNMMANEGF